MRETGMIQFLFDTEPADNGFSSVAKVAIYPYDVYTLGVFVLFLVENKIIRITSKQLFALYYCSL